MQIVRVLDAGADVLEVVAVDDDGREHTATGWVSAMTNHYDPGSLDRDGQRKPTAKPREMTADEKHAYWLSLVAPAAPVPEPVVLFEDPAAVAAAGEAP